MRLKDISTPALIVDREIFEKNADCMAEVLEGSRLGLRPHFKSHKCADIAHYQVRRGAVGITCAKLEEAIDLADSGIEDILIANQIVGEDKIARLASLAGACRLTVCVDDRENVLALQRAASFAGSVIHCLVEFEIGMQRCGVSSAEEVVDLALLIGECPNLTFDGIQAYAGHVSHEISSEEREAATAKNACRIRDLLSLLAEKGIEVKTISGGSTGTCRIKAAEGLYTELQAGSYLFMDATYGLLGLPFSQSLFILTTVVSVSDGLAVVDAGVKSCGIDQGMPVPVGFEVSHIVASEEHLQLHAPTKQLKVGDRVLLAPAHCCSTVNLHEKLYFVEGDRVVSRRFVTARGCFH